MSSLVTTYASCLGVQIEKEAIARDLLSHFFPLPFDRYITLQSSSSNQSGKNYDYWSEVIVLVKPILDKNDIKVVHLGGTDDMIVNNVIDLRGHTTIHQSHYILKKALCHIGIDSSLAHIAGANNIPVVELFGTTIDAAHGPYLRSVNTISIESHRFGRKPSFMQNESPKTINAIPPEIVARAIIKTLGLPDSIDRNTIYIGNKFCSPEIELVPNVVPSMQYNPEFPITVRMDKLFNEQILGQVIGTGRKVHIITNRPLSKLALEMLSNTRSAILSYNHEIDINCPLEYAQTVSRIIPSSLFFTKEKDAQTLNDLRFQFLDVIKILEIDQYTKEYFFKDSASYLNIDVDKLPDTSKLWFRSSKYILSNAKAYPSYAHLAADQPITDSLGNQINIDSNGNSQVIDSDEFWRDALNFYVINKK